jgi:mono/diheme cytochrome c family protein
MRRRNRQTITPIVAALAFAVAACGGGSGDTTTSAGTAGSDAVRGLEIYRTSCIACHGEAGLGVEGLGKPWVGSDFIISSTDAELLAFIQEGRPSDDPDNTTGVAMPPRGGNSSLTDSDLMDVIAYMRTLNP